VSAACKTRFAQLMRNASDDGEGDEEEEKREKNNKQAVPSNDEEIRK